MANVSYDTLTIEIGVNSKEANNSIKALSSNLRKLDKVVGELDFGAIKNAQKCLQDIAKIDFSNVSQGLNSVVSAFKAFNNAKFMKATQNGGNLSGAIDKGESQPNFTMPDNNALQTTKYDIATINNGAQQLKDTLLSLFSSAETETANLKDQLKLFVSPEFADKLASLFENFKAGINPTIDDISRVRNEMIRLIAIERLDNGSEDNPRLSGLKTILSILNQVKTQANSAKKALEGVKNSVGESGNEAKKSANGWQKLVGAFKRVLLYRVIRRAIQMVAQTLQEGIQELAQMDSGFNDSMSRITNSFKYLGNSIVSAIAPILEAITPIIEVLADGLAEVVGLFGQITAEESGADTFSEATKGAEDYAKSLKKVQSATMGIDELNVLKQEDSESHFQQVEITPSESGFKQAFEDLKEYLTPIMDALKEVVSALRPIFQTIAPILDSLKPALSAIADLIVAIAPIIQIIANLFKQLIEKTAGKVGQMLGKIIQAITKVIQVIGAIIDGLQPILEIIIDIIGTIINIFNESIITLMDIIIAILDPLIDIISSILTILQPFFQVLKSIFDFILPLLEQLNGWLGELIKACMKPLIALLEFIKPLLEALTKNVEAKEQGVSAYNYARSSGMSWWQSFEFGLINWILGLNDIQMNYETGEVSYATETPNITTPDTDVAPQETHSSNGGNNQQIVVYLDSEEVANRVIRINQNHGASTFKRSSLSYGK